MITLLSQPFPAWLQPINAPVADHRSWFLCQYWYRADRSLAFKAFDGDAVLQVPPTPVNHLCTCFHFNFRLRSRNLVSSWILDLGSTKMDLPDFSKTSPDFRKTSPDLSGKGADTAKSIENIGLRGVPYIYIYIYIYIMCTCIYIYI